MEAIEGLLDKTNKRVNLELDAIKEITEVVETATPADSENQTND